MTKPERSDVPRTDTDTVPCRHVYLTCDDCEDGFTRLEIEAQASRDAEAKLAESLQREAVLHERLFWLKGGTHYCGKHSRFEVVPRNLDTHLTADWFSPDSSSMAQAYRERIEREAVTEWLRSEDAERRLAAALPTVQRKAPLGEPWAWDEMSRLILAALRESE